MRRLRRFHLVTPSHCHLVTVSPCQFTACSKKRHSVPSAAMEESADRPVRGASPWNRALAVLGLLGICAWQAWLALGLFGPGDPWRTLMDDRPVLSGAHP